MRDNKQGTCMLIDAAIPGDRNVIKKEAEKILIYQDLIMEIQRMWNVKCEIKSDTNNSMGDWNHFKIAQTIPEQHTRKAWIKDLQKTATLCTVHKLREVLM